MTDDSVLKMWTIYGHPLDYPEGFVARQWIIAGGGEPHPGPARYRKTLAEAREAVPAGLYRLDRNPGDDPSVIETWI